MPVAVFYDPYTESIVIGISGDVAASKKFQTAARASSLGGGLGVDKLVNRCDRRRRAEQGVP